MKQVVKKEFITEADLIKRRLRVDAIPFYLKSGNRKRRVDGILTNLYSKEKTLFEQRILSNEPVL